MDLPAGTSDNDVLQWSPPLNGGTTAMPGSQVIGTEPLQWSPPLNGGTTVLSKLPGPLGAIGLQWSPPLNGGTTATGADAVTW